MPAGLVGKSLNDEAFDSVGFCFNFAHAFTPDGQDVINGTFDELAKWRINSVSPPSGTLVGEDQPITFTVIPLTQQGSPSAPAELSSLPGIGATRHDWDASHTPNAAYNNGFVYGDDPSLPSYLAPNGGVYIEVSDLGTKRIQSYALNMQTANRDEALARVRQELPSDATVAWDLTLDKCYRVAFNSASLEAAGHYMAEVQLEDIQQGGTPAPSPDRFNQASFTLYAAGTPPNPEIGC